jgi:hypothetical protein
MQDGIDLFGDGHLDAVPLGETEGGCCGKDAFGDFAPHTGEDGVELVSTAKFNANGAIAGEFAGAGKDEVSDSGESGEGLAAAATGDGESCHLGDSASDKGRGRVVTEVEAFDHSSRQCDDIFQSSA